MPHQFSKYILAIKKVTDKKLSNTEDSTENSESSEPEYDEVDGPVFSSEPTIKKAMKNLYDAGLESGEVLFRKVNRELLSICNKSNVDLFDNDNKPDLIRMVRIIFGLPY